MELEKPFKAKRYTKADLRLLYGYSRDTFRLKLHGDKTLLKRLETAGYKKTGKVLTKTQVAIIIAHLGEPFQ